MPLPTPTLRSPDTERDPQPPPGLEAFLTFLCLVVALALSNLHCEAVTFGRLSDGLSTVGGGGTGTSGGTGGGSSSARVFTIDSATNNIDEGPILVGSLDRDQNKGRGRFLVAWVDSLTGLLIREVRFDSDGEPVQGPQVAVSAPGTDPNGIAAAYRSSPAEYAFVWRQTEGIKGRIVTVASNTNDIAPPGAAEPIRDIAQDGAPDRAVVAFNETLGEYAVAWVERQPVVATGGEVLRVQRFDTELLPLSGGAGSIVAVNRAAGGTKSTPSLAWSTDGTRLGVVWLEGSDGLAGASIRGTLLSTSSTSGFIQTTGADVVFSFSDSALSPTASAPRIVLDSLEGSYLICWFDTRPGTGTTRPVPRIFARTVSPDFDALSAPLTVATLVQGVIPQPVSAAFSHPFLQNRYLLVWNDLVGGQFDIFGRFVTTDGTRTPVAVGDRLTLDGSSVTQLQPAVVAAVQASENAPFFVAWRENAGGAGDVKGRRVK